MKKIITKVCLTVAFAVIAGVLFANDATAAGKDIILGKSVAQGIFRCASGGGMKKTVKANKVSSVDDFIYDNDEDFVPFPTGYTGIDDNAVSCYELFGGYDGRGGKWDALTSVPEKVSEREAYFESLGYEKKEAEIEGGMCIVFYYLESSSIVTTQPGFGGVVDLGTKAASTHYLCANKLKNAKMAGKNEDGQDIIDGVVDVDKFSKDKSVGDEELIEFEVDKAGKVRLDCNTKTYLGSMLEGLDIGDWDYGGCLEHSFEKGSTVWSDFTLELANDIFEHRPEASRASLLTGQITWYSFDLSQRYQRVYDQITTDDLTRKFGLESYTKAAGTLAGYPTYMSMGLTKEERFFLYQDYLKNFYNASVICSPQGDAITLSALKAGRSQVYLYDVEAGQFNADCWAKATTNADKKVNGVRDREKVYYGNLTAGSAYKELYYFLQKRSFSELIDALNESKDITSLSDELKAGLSAFDDPTNPDHPEESGVAPQHELSCYDSAGSLGWVLCPIINKGQQTVEWLYGFIEGFLQINTNLFSTDGSANGTYVAWATFQSIANLAFIIIFLVVIFSQLTGFGVDNYGIKKILPKLIITALLINLSYFICQLAIDVANIIGHGIESLFSTIQGEIIQNNVAAIKMDGDTGSHVVQAGLAGGVIITIVGAICVGAVLATNGAIIVPVLVTLLTILISIVALLVILAVRQAMAVLLVVIAPCAFVCYALPNTKPLFDKWKKALSGLLLAYPICSAMIYGGEMVSTILLVANNNGGAGTSNFAIALSAAIISIAPIFLIPGIIKGSMGKISGTIANMGRGVGHHFGRRVRESNFAQDMKRREMLGKAGIKLDKNGQVQETWRGKRQRPITKAGQQRLNARRSQALRELNAMNSGETNYIGAAGMVNLQKGRNAFLANEKAQRVKDLESSIMAGNEKLNNGTQVNASDNSSLQEALTQAIQNNDEDSIRAYQNVLTSKGDKGREAVRAAMVSAIDGAGTDDESRKKMENAKRVYSQNIMDHHASDYKNNNRSVYDFAAAGQADGRGRDASNNPIELRMADEINTGSLKGSQMSDMDDGAFERLERQYQRGGHTDQSIYGAAQAALNSEQAGNMKQERRQKLEQIVSHYTGAPLLNPNNGGGTNGGGTNDNDGSNGGTNGNNNSANGNNGGANGGGNGGTNGNGGGNNP